MSENHVIFFMKFRMYTLWWEILQYSVPVFETYLERGKTSVSSKYFPESTDGKKFDPHTAQGCREEENDTDGNTKAINHFKIKEKIYILM